jgi:hypothetical protein
MIEALRSFETSVLTRATRRHIPEDGTLHTECLGHVFCVIGELTCIKQQACINDKVTKIKLSLCITKLAVFHEDIWGDGRIDLCFLDVGTSWR